MVHMGTIRFRQLPLLAKAAIGLALNNAWWSIEEFVIDRHGLWRYMPGYRVADPCVWDLGVALLTITLIGWLSRDRPEPDAPPSASGPERA